MRQQEKHKFIEVVKEVSILGGSNTKEEAPKTIRAATDSAAYLEAY